MIQSHMLCCWKFLKFMELDIKMGRLGICDGVGQKCISITFRSEFRRAMGRIINVTQIHRIPVLNKRARKGTVYRSKKGT